MVVKVFSRSPAMTRKIAREIAGKLSPGAFLLLEGDLGSGKTVFVQGLAQGLGISQKNVRSPTFAIIQEYPAPTLQEELANDPSANSSQVEVLQREYSQKISFSRKLRRSADCKAGAGLCHVDLYRLTLPEISNLGLEEYGWQNNWIVAVEWANKANNFFPDSALTIKFNFLSKNKRELIFYGSQKWKKILKLLKKF